MTLSRRSLLSAALGGAAMLGDRAARAAAPLGVGFVYLGPIGTAGWTFQHDLGRRAVAAAFGGRVTTTYVESAADDAAALAMIRRLSQTSGLVFATSSAFARATEAAARQLPRVTYESCAGVTTAPNLGAYSARFYEGRYLAGMVSAAMSRTGRLGHVVPMPAPGVVQGINALALGAQAVNPDAKVQLAWTGTWFDPVRERAAAKALIAGGCDVLSNDCGSTAVNAKAEAEGLWNTGAASDMTPVAPNTCLLSVIDDWSGYYTARVGAVLRGDWVADASWGGIGSGMIGMSPYHEVVPDHVVQRVEARKAAIVSGVFSPFDGPIRNHAGGLKVARGDRLTDDEIRAMDWLVHGVVGHTAE
jgi:simple sugar transport system substrate-binding protein